MTCPLENIRVVDFSRIIAGPLCTQQLADLGADVIKIEQPVSGDEGRRRGRETDDRGAFFQAFNRSKRSLTLDLRHPEGLALAHRLLEKADVLVQNFRPGVMQRLGLGHDELRKKYPGLVYLAISAYGQEGMLSRRPGLDPVLQAEFGMMSLTGEKDGPPIRTPLSLIDTMTAFNATAAVLAALLAREKTGQGDFIEMSLMDTAVAALGNIGSAYLNSGFLPERSGNQHLDAAPVNLFRTATAPIYAAVATQKLFRTFCLEVLETPEWLADERFTTTAARSQNRKVLYALIDEIMVKKPADFWLARMQGLPAGLVRSLPEALDSAEVTERCLIEEVPDGQSSIKMFQSPFRFREISLAPKQPAPHLGEHNAEVLQELLHMSSSEIRQLQQQGAFGPPSGPDNTGSH